LPCARPNIRFASPDAITADPRTANRVQVHVRALTGVTRHRGGAFIQASRIAGTLHPWNSKNFRKSASPNTRCRRTTRSRSESRRAARLSVYVRKAL
jgi:hypothetical protein